jgi:hypothetical protein
VTRETGFGSDNNWENSSVASVNELTTGTNGGSLKFVDTTSPLRRM